MKSFRVDVLEGGRIALSSLRGNRLRTLLTTVGIGIGVCTLLAIVGIIQGLNKSFASQLSLLGANSMYVSKFPWISHGDWWSFRNRKDLTLREAALLRSQLPDVLAVAPTTGHRLDVSFLGQPLSSVTVNGTVPEFAQVGGWEVARGRFLTDADNDNLSSVVVLGADVTEALFPHVDPIGTSVVVGNRPFRVVGTLARKGKVLGQSQDLNVYTPLRTYLSDFGKKRPLTIGLSVKPDVNMRKAQDDVEAILRRSRATPADKPNDFAINRPEQLANTYAELTGALFGVAVGIGLITLIVGGIGIMNVMLVSVRERTREIGVRRALGARRRTIVFQFLMEAAAVSAVGGALGTVVGLSCAKVISMTTPLAATVEPLTVVGGVGFAALAGLIFGIWPAARAANLDPVEALRHE